MTRRQLLVPAGLALASILGGLGVAVAQTARSADEDDLGTFPLSDSTWVIEEAATTAIILMWQGRPPTLSFPREGGAELHGCNTLSASLKSFAAYLTFAPRYRTLMGCARFRRDPVGDQTRRESRHPLPGDRGEWITQDQRLEQALVLTASYQQIGDVLLLRDKDGRVTLRLRRQR